MIHECDAASAVYAAELLDEYRAGESFFFSTARHTMLAQGSCAEIRCPAGLDLPDVVASALGNALGLAGEPPVAVGAVPFDSAQQARLRIPAQVLRGGPLRLPLEHAPQRPVLTSYAARSVPAPAEHMRNVERALAIMAAGEVRKIVLARTLELESPEAVDVHQLLRNLAQRNPGSYTFAAETGGGRGQRRTMVGASPELLVARHGTQVVSNPLAGSAARSPDQAEDKRRAAALLASAKDRREHAVVVEAVAAALRPFCRTLDVPAEPSLISTPTMWHLSTRVTGELLDPAISSLTLALALHPTPAVCGTPTAQAREAIRSIEPFDRGFYSGVVGWCDAEGDGEWVVTLRCAEVAERSVRLFAGGGIVPGSRPEAELAETSAKFRTMLQAMGLGQEAKDL